MDETSLRCRLTGSPLDHVFVDLGRTPLANSYVDKDKLGQERFYPLKAYVSSESLLVQLPSAVEAETIFSDYAYFSSYSDAWLAHAREYVAMASERFRLGRGSHVVELASNDGYLLQYFVERGVQVTGIEPAANVAAAAQKRGIPTRIEFFGRDSARSMAADGVAADLMVANNVMAHVPDLNDFLAGVPLVLKPHGVITIEFPHLARLIEHAQFDTIYHEHFSYFSFLTAVKALEKHGMRVFDVEELPTHGGSLRVFASHRNADAAEIHPESPHVTRMHDREREAGLHRLETYLSFAPRVDQVKRELLEFLTRARSEGKTVAGYGAPAKATTLLNVCGVGPELLAYTVDRSPHKQGKYLPGVHVPILAPDTIARTRPDYVLILPWNLKAEIAAKLASISEWGGKLVVPIPQLEVLT